MPRCRGGKCGRRTTPARATQPAVVRPVQQPVQRAAAPSAMDRVRQFAAAAAPVVGGIGGTMVGGPLGGMAGYGAGQVAAHFIRPGDQAQQQQAQQQQSPMQLPGGDMEGMAPFSIENPTSWKGELIGKPGGTQFYPLFTSAQHQNILSPINSQISQLLQQLGQGGFNFQSIADRARRQFQTQTVPSLAERFTAMGGGQRSSAFQGALGQAGSDLESSLSELGSKYGLLQDDQRRQLLSTLLSAGLAPRYQSAAFPASPGFLPNLANSAAQGFSAGLAKNLFS